MIKFIIVVVTLFNFNFQGFSQCIPDLSSGLITQWDFNNNALDFSGNMHDGIPVNVNIDTNRCGQLNSAYRFWGTGTSQYIKVNYSPSLNLSNTDFTFSTWINLDDTTATSGVGFNNMIISKRTDYFLSNGYCSAILQNQQFQFAIAGGGAGSSLITSKSSLCNRVWNHIVTTFNNTTKDAQVYINGILDTTIHNIVSPTPTTANFRIGNDVLNNAYQFNGKIDDIRLYNRILTSCEINSLYHLLCIVSKPKVISNSYYSICAGSSLFCGGSFQTQSGTYYDTLTTNICTDTIKITNLIVQPVIFKNTSDTICSNQTFMLPWGVIVNSSGIYHDTLPYTSGCDSLIMIVNLMIQSHVNSTMDITICSGQTYTLPWGPIVSSSGTYLDTLHYTTGCDSSIRTVNLIVQSPIISTINDTICSGQTYALPWGNIVNSTGSYHNTLYYVSGCDSLIRTVNLIVQSLIISTIYDTTCEGTLILPWGTLVNSSGIYYNTLHYTSGCDSLIKIANITIRDKPIPHLTAFAELCVNAG